MITKQTLLSLKYSIKTCWDKRTLPPAYPGRQMHFPVRALHPLEKAPHVQLREQADPYFPKGHWQKNS